VSTLLFTASPADLSTRLVPLRTSLGRGDLIETGTQTTPSKKHRIDEIISPIAFRLSSAAREHARDDTGGVDIHNSEDGSAVKLTTNESNLPVTLDDSNKGWEKIQERNISKKKMVSILPGCFITELRRVPCHYSYDQPNVSNPILIPPVASVVPLLLKDATSQACHQISKTLKNITRGEERRAKKNKVDKETDRNKKATRSSLSSLSVHEKSSKARYTISIEPLLQVHSLGVRILLIEDIFNLEINRSVCLFYKQGGLPPRHFNRLEEC